MTEMWSDSSIVCPSNITMILRVAITSLHVAATTVLFNILSAIIVTYRLCKRGILPITGVLFTVCDLEMLFFDYFTTFLQITFFVCN